MRKHRFAHPLTFVLAFAFVFVQETMSLAGTTGALSGTVTDSASKPVTAATVTATSPSQSVTTKTDGGGHFTFASLAPDTYTISAEKNGFEPLAQSGVNVFADQNQTVMLTLRGSLKEIGRVASRSTSEIVRPGTTADTYSVNAATADKVAALGGGGALNQAYSAVASVPGVYVPTGGTGWFQTIQIRGGSFDQVGYELDGVPVNRSFDTYPAHTASSLGQSELQVYTGSAPANSESQGLSGFVNQVIRTGSFPGFGTIDLGVGGPSFYHQASFEAGGATRDRLFSYYVGLSGANQDFRPVDQFSGTALSSIYGTPFAYLGKGTLTNNVGSNVEPNGYALLPFDIAGVSTVRDRENVVNLHFGIPHHGGAGRDDIQLLYDVGGIDQFIYDSPNDQGPAVLAITGPVMYPSGFSYTGPLGAALPANPASLIANYAFPTRESSAAVSDLVPLDRRSVQQNDQAILKLQYQKNFSAGAFFRLYAYSFYSDFFQNDPNDGNLPVGISTDYELSTHTRGVSGTFADQLSSHHLLQFQGSFTGATSLRSNNSQFFNGNRPFAFAVDSNAPYSGVCYAVAGGTATPAQCDGKLATYVTYNSALNPAGPATNASRKALGNPLTGVTCGTGPCEFFTAENGSRATFNRVRPAFARSASPMNGSRTIDWCSTAACVSTITRSPGLTRIRRSRISSSTRGTIRTARTRSRAAHRSPKRVAGFRSCNLVLRSTRRTARSSRRR